MSTVTKRGETYRITVSCGYDMDGKQIRKSTTWKPEPGMTKKQIEKELERQKVLFEEKVNNGLFVGENIKFASFAELWFKNYGKEHLKATTYKNYRDCMKRILPAIGHIPLNKLQPHHLIAFYENLEENGIRSDTKYQPKEELHALLKERQIRQYQLAEAAGLSVGTVRSVVHGNHVAKPTAEKICVAISIPFAEYFQAVTDKEKLSGTTALYYHRVISSILQTAVYWQVIPSNPCSRVKPPKAEHKEARFLDDAQARELLRCLDSEPLIYKTLFNVILFSGMRRGEICGLTWSDVDFEHGIVDINKSSLYLVDRGIFDDDTKNASSRRVIRLPDQALQLLKEWKTEQDKQRLKAGDRWQNSGKVFTSWDGKPIHPDTVSGWFHDFIRRHDLPEITVHSLRHTNATLLIASGTDIKTVSKRLGHANVTTTGNIYTHAIKTADEIAADTLNDILNIPKKA